MRSIHPSRTSLRRPRTWCALVLLYALLLGLTAFPGCSGPQCKEVDDCPTGQSCNNGQCQVVRPVCTSANDCAKGQLCEEGSCKTKPSPICQTDADCQADEICNNGTCTTKPSPTCQSNVDCESGQVCEKGICKPTDKGCQAPEDCQADEICNNGRCVPKPTGDCAADTDCQPGETCAGGSCRPKDQGCPTPTGCIASDYCEKGICKPKQGGCQSNSDCQGGRYCFQQNRCLPDPPSCRSTKDCRSNMRCVRVSSTRRVCLSNCNPTKNKKDGSNASCFGGYGWCFRVLNTSATIGVCLPPRRATRKKDQSCKSLDPKNASYDMCAAGAPCRAGKCAAIRKKIREAGQRCGLGDEDEVRYHICKEGLLCFRNTCETPCDRAQPEKTCKANQWCYALGSASACLNKCDPAKGIVTNPACPAGTYCKSDSGRYRPGACQRLPYTKQGPKREGESCSNFNFTKFCDSNRGLFCNYPRCARACDPRQGRGNNKACKAHEECLDQSSYSHLGGICLPKATATKGDSCNSTNLRCKSGLICYRSRCVTRCSSSQPQPGGCGSTEVCYKSNGGVCLNKCNPQEGYTTNPKCPTFAYCVKSSSKVTPGYCQLLYPKRKGPRKAGERCSNLNASQFCDTNKGLYCNSFVLRCVKTCDPRKGTKSNPNCESNESCLNNPPYSYTGGGCIPHATRKAGETCDALNNRCVSGNLCLKFGSRYHCAKACDPRKPNSCGNNESCQKVSSSSSGRYACLQKQQKTRKLYQACDGPLYTPSYDNCIAPYLCVGASDVSYCLPKCDPRQQNACQNGFRCVPLRSGGGICLKPCQRSRDCTTYKPDGKPNASCRQISSNTKVCL